MAYVSRKVSTTPPHNEASLTVRHHVAAGTCQKFVVDGDAPCLQQRDGLQDLAKNLLFTSTHREPRFRRHPLTGSPDRHGGRSGVRGQAPKRAELWREGRAYELGFQRAHTQIRRLNRT